MMSNLEDNMIVEEKVTANCLNQFYPVKLRKYGDQNLINRQYQNTNLMQKQFFDPHNDK